MKQKSNSTEPIAPKQAGKCVSFIRPFAENGEQYKEKEVEFYSTSFH
jgi:hypothetical protein